MRYQFYAILEKALILFQRVAFLYVWLFLFWGFCLFVFGILFLLSCFFKYISKSYRNLYKISTYGEVSFIKQTNIPSQGLKKLYAVNHLHFYVISRYPNLVSHLSKTSLIFKLGTPLPTQKVTFPSVLCSYMWPCDSVVAN